MEGRGPYRIYDPGGGVPLEEASAAFERLVEENSRLKEKMQGIRMLGKADPALFLQAPPCSLLCPSWHMPLPKSPPPSCPTAASLCTSAARWQQLPASQNRDDRPQNSLRDRERGLVWERGSGQAQSVAMDAEWAVFQKHQKWGELTSPGQPGYGPQGLEQGAELGLKQGRSGPWIPLSWLWLKLLPRPRTSPRSSIGLTGFQLRGCLFLHMRRSLVFPSRGVSLSSRLLENSPFALLPPSPGLGFGGRAQLPVF